MMQDFVKLERFDGSNFPRWQKVHFILSKINVEYVLTIPKPEAIDDETVAQTRTRVKCERDNRCKGHILNAMIDPLFDIYHNKGTAMEIWEALEVKYLLVDARGKKYLVSRFFNFKMTEDKLVPQQLNEIQHLIGAYPSA